MQSIQHRSFCAAPGQAACCMNRMYRQHCAVGDWQMALVWACLTRKAEDDGCENITVNIALFLVTAFEESEDISNALPDLISTRLMELQARRQVQQESVHHQKHVYRLPCHCSHVAGREPLSNWAFSGVHASRSQMSRGQLFPEKRSC